MKSMQKCLLITGMHRSGTSALTGVISKLNVHLGRELMPSNTDNPKGFFENQKIYEFNEKVLKQLKSSWDDIFVSNKLPTKSIQYLDELKEIIIDEFGQSDFFAIKDPRICLLFPLYSQVLKSLNIEIMVIISWRNPLEVANSLHKRNTFSYSKSFILWTKYFLFGEYYSRNHKRVFVLFDNVVLNPYSSIKNISDKLELNFSQLLETHKEEIEDFVDPDLKHNNVDVKVESDECPKFIKKIMKYQNSFGSEAIYERLDLLREIFCEYEEMTSLPQIVLDHTKELQTKEEKIAEQSKLIQNKDHRIQALKNRLTKELQAKEEKIAEQSKLIQNKERRIQSLENSLTYL